MTPAVPRRVFLQHFRSPNPAFILTRHVSTCSAHCSPPPSTSVTCWPPLPRHQPEPYIRRRSSHASSARHICTFAAHLLFLFLSFSCFLSRAALVALFSYLVRTSVCSVSVLGYGPRSTVSLLFSYRYTPCTSTVPRTLTRPDRASLHRRSVTQNFGGAQTIGGP